MSLILEALKKSERQRRLGESPSIGSPIMAVRQRRNWLPYLAVLIVVGLALLWWLKRDVEQPPAEPAVAAINAPSVAETNPEAPKPATAARAIDMPAAAPSESIARRDPNRTTQPVPALRVPRENANPNPTTKEKLASGELVVADQQSNAPGQPPIVKESEAVPATAQPAAAPAPGNTDAIAIGELLNRADKQPAADAAGTAAASPAKASTVPAPVASRPGDAPILIWELPLATRRELPEIKLSMHVYAEDPAQRFVIVNGDRHGEGDDVGSIKLIEIRKDGVVFEANKQRFLYPRGGR